MRREYWVTNQRLVFTLEPWTLQLRPETLKSGASLHPGLGSAACTIDNKSFKRRAHRQLILIRMRQIMMQTNNFIFEVNLYWGFITSLSWRRGFTRHLKLNQNNNVGHAKSVLKSSWLNVFNEQTWQKACSLGCHWWCWKTLRHSWGQDYQAFEERTPAHISAIAQ